MKEKGANGKRFGELTARDANIAAPPAGGFNAFCLWPCADDNGKAIAEKARPHKARQQRGWGWVETQKTPRTQNLLKGTDGCMRRGRSPVFPCVFLAFPMAGCIVVVASLVGTVQQGSAALEATADKWIR